MIRIALVWSNFASPNFGVGALSVGQLSILGNLFGRQKFEILLVGNPEASEFDLLKKKFPDLVTHKIDFKIRSIASLMRYIKEVKRCDLVLNCGEGDSFSDIYGFKRWFRFFLAAVLSVFVNRKCIIMPQTIGPFRNSLLRRLSVSVLSKHQEIFVRDTISQSMIELQSSRCNVRLVPDLAFYSKGDFSAFLGSENSVIGNSSTFKLCLNVSGLLASGEFLRVSEDQYKAVLLQIIENLSTTIRSLNNGLEIPLEIFLLPHVISITGRDDDIYGCDWFEHKVAPFIGSKYTLNQSKQICDFEDFRELVSGCDLFIGSRMHAVIGALCVDVPTIALSYSSKFIGTLAWLGFESIYELDSNDIQFGEAKEKLAQLVKDGVVSANDFASNRQIDIDLIKNGEAELVEAIRSVFEAS